MIFSFILDNCWVTRCYTTPSNRCLVSHPMGLSGMTERSHRYKPLSSQNEAFYLIFLHHYPYVLHRHLCCLCARVWEDADLHRQRTASSVSGTALGCSRGFMTKWENCSTLFSVITLLVHSAALIFFSLLFKNRFRPHFPVTLFPDPFSLFPCCVFPSSVATLVRISCGWGIRQGTHARIH